MTPNLMIRQAKLCIACIDTCLKTLLSEDGTEVSELEILGQQGGVHSCFLHLLLAAYVCHDQYFIIISQTPITKFVRRSLHTDTCWKQLYNSLAYWIGRTRLNMIIHTDSAGV